MPLPRNRLWARVPADGDSEDGAPKKISSLLKDRAGYYGVIMGFLIMGFLWGSYGVIMGFLWGSYGVPMGFLGFLWGSYGFEEVPGDN